MSRRSTQKTARELIASEARGAGNESYLNPFIGTSSAESWGKVESGMELLSHLLEGDSIDDVRHGLSLLVSTIWSAVQFEVEVAEREKRVSRDLQGGKEGAA